LADPETGKTVSFTPAVSRKDAWIHAVSPDGLTALVRVDEGKWRLHDLPSGELRAEWTDEEATSGHTYTPDGKSMAVWEQQKETWSLKLRSVSDLTTRTILANQKDPGWLVFAPDGKTFARELPGNARPWRDWELRDTATGKLLSTIPMPDDVPLFS